MSKTMATHRELLECKRCGWTWLPKVKGKPKNCPSCNSPYWETTVTKEKQSKAIKKYQKEQRELRDKQ